MTGLTAVPVLLRIGKLMPHLVALGGKVAGVVLVDRRQDRHLIDDFQVEAAVDEGVGLLGVVGQAAELS